MISILDQLSQDYIQVSNGCNYPCLRCNTQQASKDQYSYIFKSIVKGTFFSFFKRVRLFNIIGGDPFEYDDLLPLCRFLQREAIKVRLWINPSVNHDLLLQVLPFVDEVAINLPHIETIYLDDYLNNENIKDLEDTIFLLKNEKKSFFIHHFVTKDSLAYLPNMYDYIYNLPYKYVFHYSSSGEGGFDKNDMAHVNYYRHLPNVLVFPNSFYLKHACTYIPVSLFAWRFKVIIYLISIFWIRFKKRLDI